MNCTRCKLALGRLCIVKPWGPAPADALFLVDAPTAIDERLKSLGRTPEYRLLAAMISDAAERIGQGVPTYRFHPIISCRPAMGPQAPDREPQPDEILACVPNVQRAIKAIDPAVVFFMGKTVERYWRKELPEAITLLPLWLLMKQGGTQSPNYTSTVRSIAGGFRQIPTPWRQNEKVT